MKSGVQQLYIMASQCVLSRNLGSTAKHCTSQVHSHNHIVYLSLIYHQHSHPPATSNSMPH